MLARFQKEHARESEAREKREAAQARQKAEEAAQKLAEERAQAIRAALELDASGMDVDLFGAPGSNSTPTTDGAGKLDLDNLFEKVEEESEKQRKLREELEAIEREKQVCACVRVLLPE